MITLLQVQKEISEKSSELVRGLKPGQVKRIKARIKFLTLVKHYLESAPSEEYIEREKKKIDKNLTVIDGRFNAWCASNKQHGWTLQEQKKQFQKEYDIKKLQSQQKALSFILNKKSNEVLES